MKRWFTTLTFKTPPTPEVLANVPAELARVAELKSQGHLQAAYVSTIPSAWLVMIGDTLEVVNKNLATLPLYPYFNVEIAELTDLGA